MYPIYALTDNTESLGFGEFEKFLLLKTAMALSHCPCTSDSIKSTSNLPLILVFPLCLYLVKKS